MLLTSYPGLYVFSKRLVHYNEGYVILDFLWDLKISSFTAMIAIAFLIGYHLIKKEFRRQNFETTLADTLLLISIAGGFAGAKLFGVIENYKHFQNIEQAWKALTMPGSLTWYGGLIVPLILFLFVMKRYTYSNLRVLDAITPAIALSYGIGRLGCMFSGDGCYGTLCTILPFPLCANFSLGSDAYTWSLLTQQAKLQGVAPMAYNTPFYDFLLGTILFFTLSFLLKRNSPKENSLQEQLPEPLPEQSPELLQNQLSKEKYSEKSSQKRAWPMGYLFFLYIGIHSLYRFVIEFIRLNEKLLGPFTQAQIISLLILSLIALFFVFARRFQRLANTNCGN